jgi:MFS family permease
MFNFGAKLLAALVGSFHPRTLHPMMRNNYARELQAWWLLAIMLAMVEGGVLSVVIKNVFDGVAGIGTAELNIVVAILSAAPAVANISSFVWVRLAHGKPKVRFLVACQAAMAILVILIAFAPNSRFGLYLVACCGFGARIFWASVVTIRSTIWRANYPKASRANVAGKLAMVQSAMVSLTGLCIGMAMDWNEQIFHLLFPLGGLAGLAGMAVYSRVRLRGQQRLARLEQHSDAHTHPSFNPVSLWRVLSDDPEFRAYQICMFVFGIGNLMVMAVLPIVVKDHFNFEYLAGILVTSTIPAVMIPLAIPFWSKIFDQSHVVQFRARHSWVYVTSIAMVLVATSFNIPWLLFLSAATAGLGHAGGVLAWNLGHHDYAEDYNDSKYMSVHVTLTGIRGLIGPLICVAIYQWLELPTTPGQGTLVFILCLALSVTGALGFVHIAREQSRES